MHCLLTGRSVTGVLHFLNKTCVDWFTKKQSTAETATYGSEFSGARTCVDQVLDMRTTLRYLGVRVKGKAKMWGDNKSVVESASFPFSRLHKRHHILAFHRVRQAIASGVVDFHHLPGDMNPADILSKHWGYGAVWPMLQPLLFWAGDTANCP